MKKHLLFALVVAAVATSLFAVWFGYSPTAGVDSDGDGIPDWLEQVLGLDPLVVNNSGGDLDGDGISNIVDTVYGNHLIVTIQPVAGERIP